jgi:hypothetical protein
MTRTRWTAMACVIVGAMIIPLPVSAECLNQKIGQIYLPMNLKNVPSAAHVMASVMTSKGLFEARASQEQNGTSQITFFLDGKEMKPLETSEQRRETNKCGGKRGALIISEPLYSVLSTLRSSIITEAEASYGSNYQCNGTGAVEIVLRDSEERATGGWTFIFVFKQGGRVCGFAQIECSDKNCA